MRAVGYIRGRAIDLDLVDVGGGFRLHSPVAAAFLAMEEHAARDGIELRVNSAWRSMAQQMREYDLRAQALRRGKKYKAVARPGWSTHQSGCSVDLNRAHDDHTDNGVADGVTDQWLQKNAATYGFYNDVRSEPWHWTHLATVKALETGS